MAVVLVVDDSPVDRTRAGGLLKKHSDLTPAFASNGREALASIAERPPDLVVTDLQMPEMDGLALVETVRKTVPGLPVILMTAHGSEEIAVQALRKGAASYVAKRNLAAELVDMVRSVLEIARADLSQKHILACLTLTESHYELGNEIGAIAPLIGQLEANLDRMHLCDETGLIRVAVALREALVNAIYHGNLDLTSALLEDDEARFVELAALRPHQEPYARRRVSLIARETRNEVTYVVRDEGQGFDVASLPDPTLPQNLERRTGRGLFLIRTFMDEVRHNDVGNEITMVKRRDAAAPGATPGPLLRPTTGTFPAVVQPQTTK
jgi:CheY-like chemotaxis protein/anti-sigma regulatory factor (Ser/Thr protein kinase)